MPSLPSLRVVNTFAVILLQMISVSAVAHAAVDSVVVPFRVYGSAGTTHYVPGQFNGWVSNGAASQMTYDASLGAWKRLYTFKVHAPGDPQRTLGDSVYQYKFNAGGGSGGWFSDPLNPERNALDNNNSVLRLTDRFWFQYYAHLSAGQITRITVGLVAGTMDSVTRIELSTAVNQTSTVTRTEVVGSFSRVNRTLDHTLAASIGENSFVEIKAWFATGDSVVIARGGYSLVIAPMPAGLRHGVNLPTGPGDSVGFRFRSPMGSLVFLRLSPVGQSAATASPIVMKKHISSADWWIHVNLPPGTYDYLFEISNGPQVADPWGRTQTGTASRFTVGPAGLSADDYVWASNAFQRPAQKNLVIYELNVAEFAGGAVGRRGNLLDMVSLLPYLDSLGINAIELMPVMDYGNLGPSGFSWGYDLSSYFALEPSYGTARDLKTFVDSAHARGMAVIMDLVFNHLNDPSPLWQMAPNVDINPYFKNPGGAYNEDGLVFFKDLDHWTPETQEHVYESIKMWIDEFRIDGFRYDYTQGIGWNIADTTKGILGWANRIHREYSGAVYQIAEHLPESPALLYYSGINGGWHDSFRDRVFDEARFRNQTLSAIEDQVLDLGAFPSNDTPAQPSRYAERSEPINYTVSHDEQSLVYEMNVWQGRPMSEALVRDRLYAVFMFTSLGVPMLWQGQETGESRGWGNDGVKLSYRPMDWARLSTPEGRSHWYHYRTLVRQRTLNPALRDGQLRKLYRYEAGGQKVLVWGMEHVASGSSVMVVANLNPTETTITSVPWITPGTWFDVFTQAPLVASGTTIASITVPGYTALVYANRTDAELNIPTSVSEPATSVMPEHFSLLPNYPNPFNPETQIEYTVGQAGAVEVAVYSVLGQRVATLAEGHHAAGRYRVTWRAAGPDAQPSGVYFVRMQAGGLSRTQRMVYLR
ncbi:MAG: alpha-amylase family glycosyl hydrolase [Bacteroidetes bacterium]|jgi:1,4-alpha-glucan branching enzyme|nr:alpha-amylase family glycosyl hydrolase [Bacteroidota bacterium]